MKNRIWARFVIFFALNSLFFLSCIEPFDRISSNLQSFVMVEGKWTNVAEKNYVLLRNSVPVDVSTYSYFQAITGADVQIIEDNTTHYKLQEAEIEGYYIYDKNDAVAKTGHSYQLQIILPDGKTYLSDIEQCLQSPAIENISHQYGDDYFKSATETTPGYHIYLSTQDPAAEKNYYKWDWELYEEQLYCYTCSQGVYFRDENTGDQGACIITNEFGSHQYDYECDGSCWDILVPTKFYVMSDELSDGLPIKNTLIGEMPIYQLRSALLKVYQYAISKKYYDYVQLMKSIGQNTGGLADTPPAALVGNIRNVNDSTEVVSGYFLTSAVSTVDYWLDKSDVPRGISPIGLLGGRNANPDPTNRPPRAPCYRKLYRTPYMPKGWM